MFHTLIKQVASAVASPLTDARLFFYSCRSEWVTSYFSQQRWECWSLVVVYLLHQHKKTTPLITYWYHSTFDDLVYVPTLSTCMVFFRVFVIWINWNEIPSKISVLTLENIEIKIQKAFERHWLTRTDMILWKPFSVFLAHCPYIVLYIYMLLFLIL